MTKSKTTPIKSRSSINRNDIIEESGKVRRRECCPLCNSLSIIKYTGGDFFKCRICKCQFLTPSMREAHEKKLPLPKALATVAVKQLT
jgi:ribosomal protein L37AE/L43A